MLNVLFMVLIGFIVSLFGFDNLIGLHGTGYYLAFAVFGAVCHTANLIKR